MQENAPHWIITGRPLGFYRQYSFTWGYLNALILLFFFSDKHQIIGKFWLSFEKKFRFGGFYPQT